MEINLNRKFWMNSDRAKTGIQINFEKKFWQNQIHQIGNSMTRSLNQQPSYAQIASKEFGMKLSTNTDSK